jgi:hypothetical protein
MYAETSGSLRASGHHARTPNPRADARLTRVESVEWVAASTTSRLGFPTSRVWEQSSVATVLNRCHGKPAPRGRPAQLDVLVPMPDSGSPRMNMPPAACERCDDEGRIPRPVVVGMHGEEPVIAEGWVPCDCGAGDDEGTPCIACHGIGRLYVELSHTLAVETEANWRACEHCDGTGTEPPRPLLGILARFFEEDGWVVTEQPEHEILWVGFEGNNGQWKCCAQAREEEQQFVFYSICPRRVEPQHRAAMAEFITRANYGIVIGNFELDYADGEVRFKTSIDVEDARLTPPLIHHLVYANLLMTDRYLPGITAIIEGQSPQLALELVEGQPN